MWHARIFPSLALCFQLAAAVASPSALSLEIPKEEYQAIEATANKIIARFPQDQYYYLVAGRSLAPFVAYFLVRDRDSAGNLPVGHLRQALNIEFRSVTDKERLQRHFLRFLPSPAMIHGRKILLIDHLWTGQSLWRTKDYLRLLFRDAYPFETFGMVYEPYDRDFSRTIDHKMTFKNKDLLTLIVTKKYQDYSSYGPANLTEALEKLEDLNANPKFAELLAAMERAKQLYSCESNLD